MEKKMINNSERLITGGTGSLGKQITKILCSEYNPRGIRIYSRSEYNQWEMKGLEWQWNKNYIPIDYILGDVRDKENLSRALNRVDLVFHCAAMKQVPACEENPFEAIEINIGGAKNLIDACIDNGVEKCMNISTDKAVYPINLYSKTKAVAESLFIYGNTYSGLLGTQFNSCRYGNVLGSRGSIIPLFKEQAKSGTITITDKKMTRFWITIDKVARFVIDRMSNWNSGCGNIFIPKMPSMKILNIAKVVMPDAKIKEIGIRKGEKLHECLITFEESKYLKETENFYILSPLDEAIESDKNWAYYTDTNDRWMTENELKEMI